MQPVASSSRYGPPRYQQHPPQQQPYRKMDRSYYERPVDPYYEEDVLVPLSPRLRPTQLLPLQPYPVQMQMSFQMPFNYYPPPQFYPPRQYSFFPASGSAPPPQPEIKGDDGYPVHQCPKCEKQYKGKHARSIWRRHLQDKHNIPLSMQVRRSRWDTDPNRPANSEEKRQRMLESKRRWAAKKRLERRAAKMQVASPEPGEDIELDEEQEREWQHQMQLDEEVAAAEAKVKPKKKRAPSMARTDSSRAVSMARSVSNTSQPSQPEYALPPVPKVELQQTPAPAPKAAPPTPAPATHEAATSLLIMQSSPAHPTAAELEPPFELAQSRDLFVSAGVRGSSPICSPFAEKSDEDKPRFNPQRVDTTPTPLRRVFGRQSALKPRRASHSDPDDPFCPGLTSSNNAPSSSARTRDSPMTPMTPLVANTRILNGVRTRPPPPPFPRDAWAKDSQTPSKLFASTLPTPLQRGTPYQSSPRWQLSSPNGLSLTHSLGLAPSGPPPETPGWADMLSGGTPDHRLVQIKKRQPPMSAERNRWPSDD